MLYDYIQNKFVILDEKKRKANPDDIPTEQERIDKLNEKYNIMLDCIEKDVLDIFKIYKNCLQHEIDIKTNYIMNKKDGVSFSLIKTPSDDINFGYDIMLEFITVSNKKKSAIHLSDLDFVASIKNHHKRYNYSSYERYQSQLESMDKLVAYFEIFKDQFYQEVNAILDKQLKDVEECER